VLQQTLNSSCIFKPDSTARQRTLTSNPNLDPYLTHNPNLYFTLPLTVTVTLTVIVTPDPNSSARQKLSTLIVNTITLIVNTIILIVNTITLILIV
jgi:hypothetical protein